MFEKSEKVIFGEFTFHISHIEGGFGAIQFCTNKAIQERLTPFKFKKKATSNVEVTKKVLRLFLYLSFG